MLEILFGRPIDKSEYMKIKIRNKVLIVLFMFLLGCEDQLQKQTQGNYQKTLMEALITAERGTVIEIPEGVHDISRGLSLKMDGVTIRGAGMDKSVLSFKNQIQGSEGLTITADDIRLENFAVEDLSLIHI